jgi:hypothetical protein
MMAATESTDVELRAALREAASALKANGPAFALAGTYALWVHGAPEPVHDVDLVVAEQDVDDAAKTLEDAGFRVTRTPEDWLFKASIDPAGQAVVDVLHRLNREVVTPERISACEVLDVLAIPMPVMSPTDVVTQKLRSMHEHHCDFEKLLPPVRAVRERVDWDVVARDTEDNDFAAAFLYLLNRLGIARRSV